ncbi:hypothetical protein [Campylobacter geochelonis]|uniref:Uncharacterized protein n=1 Tax=Campylobacter geochelonis TaxID=1780362 RepID=A0A128EKQ8_9BACT|nr:hypothetical protein [Campylobacter geochelonis]CZE49151.1 Uncharacterised protein [Campylobacter geochelonis]
MYDERPKNDFFTKVFIRLGIKVFIKNKINIYYNNILENSLKLDYVFIISPESITVEIINKFKDKNPNLKIIIYMWDSIKNKKNALPLINLADKSFTFDDGDLLIREDIEFLPLFYTKNYSDIFENTKFKYDISFIGTIHSDRYEIAKKIEKEANKAGLKTLFFFYSPSKILFFIQKILYSKFRKIPYRDVSFKSMLSSEIINIFYNSKVILDINHPK